ncbi:MAG: 5'-methylthioadenosine/adenosylhomocysteine nucleosidase [Clostridia bacterium]|nr:5'-methylthioadenosine/adenosylhomocysteine nucleosidase [Clostridia bacterium]
MKKIGLIGAMDSEITAFRRDFHAVETPHKGILCGSFSDYEIYICCSGVGKVNAAIAAQRLIDLCGVQYMINSGVAGGLAKEIAKLDIVISKQLTYHDFSPLELLDKYPPCSHMMQADAELCEKALHACDALNEKLKKDGKLPFTSHLGTIVSGDCFVSSAEKAQQLRDDFDALCTEMEGASIAHVCTVAKIPFVIIRAISDFADEDAENSFESFETVAADRAAFIVKELLS